MHPYTILIACASMACAACAGGLYVHDPRRRASRLAALLLLGASFWAACELAWNLSDDAEHALRLVRLSAAGWVFVGPLTLHSFAEAMRSWTPAVRRLTKTLYALAALALPIAWTTPWVIQEAVRTSWGWGYITGPGHWFYYSFTMLGVCTAIWLVVRSLRGEDPPVERAQQPWIAVAVGVPLVVASVTDALLPWMGYQPPRLGTTSFAVLGLTAVYTVLRYGYSFLSPGAFADQILATLPDGVALLHGGERIRSANLGLARLSGYGRDELIGMPVAELLTWSFGRLPEDGDEVDCELARAGGDRIPVAVTASVLHDPRESAVGQVLVVRDLREVADLRTRLLLSARLAAVGELAAGIAHEINNPIAFIRANLSRLQSHWKQLRSPVAESDFRFELRDLVSEGDELIEESLEGVDRAAEIVRGVRGFSHAGSLEREAADLNRLLDDVLHMAAAELRNRAQIDLDYAELPPVRCAPQQMKQVFLNLIVNAAHAIGESGRIRVTTAAGDGEVTVRVEDDGCGIEPEILDRIFDPFFTTKGVGEGTGLGLGIAYQIVHSHDGTMRVDSRPGEGTCFTVRLPVG